MSRNVWVVLALSTALTTPLAMAEVKKSTSDNWVTGGTSDVIRSGRDDVDWRPHLAYVEVFDGFKVVYKTTTSKSEAFFFLYDRNCLVKKEQPVVFIVNNQRIKGYGFCSLGNGGLPATFFMPATNKGLSFILKEFESKRSVDVSIVNILKDRYSISAKGFSKARYLVRKKMKEMEKIRKSEF